MSQTKLLTIAKAIESAAAGLTLAVQHETDGRLGILTEGKLAEAICLLETAILEHGELRADGTTPAERVYTYTDDTLEAHGRQ